jgi:hypothetical protein
MNDLTDLEDLPSVERIKTNEVNSGVHAVMLSEKIEGYKSREVRVAWLKHFRDDYAWLAANTESHYDNQFVLLEEK